MTATLFLITSALYLLASTAFALLLFAGREKSGSIAIALLAGAGIAHIGFLVADIGTHTSGFSLSIQETLALASLLFVVGYLLSLIRYRVLVLGAFITPLTLLFFWGASLVKSVGEVPSSVRSVILPIHIGVNVLGLVAFALAFVTSVAYMIQERQLRQRKLGGVTQRLPSLDVLDSFSLRLVTIGFPLLTVGIITGALWSSRLANGTIAISPAQTFGVLAWVFFGGVLLLRLAAGWRGRRAAIGTMLGFACALFVVLGYALRAMGGGS